MTTQETGSTCGPIEMWSPGKLRIHPENEPIFGEPQASEQYKSIRDSIRKHGVWEPIIAKRDGTILAGHLRRACAEELKLAQVPVRVHAGFATYADEVAFVVRSNTDRRQLTPAQIAFAFKRLKQLPREAGGVKRKRGRPAGGNNSAESSGLSDSRDVAAAKLGISRNIADACETVFKTDGVPESLKRAVDAGDVAPTMAAKAIRDEVRRQGGSLKTVTALDTLAERGSKKEVSHADRVAEQARAYREDFGALTKLYAQLNGLLVRRPLKTVIGWTEHSEYADLIRSIAIRANRELETVNGANKMGKQLALTVIAGGKK